MAHPPGKSFCFEQRGIKLLQSKTISIPTYNLHIEPTFSRFGKLSGKCCEFKRCFAYEIKIFFSLVYSEYISLKVIGFFGDE